MLVEFAHAGGPVQVLGTMMVCTMAKSACARPWPALASSGSSDPPCPLVGGCQRAHRALRHSEHARLLSNIEKLTLPILGSMLPFWIPTGDLVCQLEATSTWDSLSVVCCSPQSTFRRPARRRVRGPRAPLARSTRANTARGRDRGPPGDSIQVPRGRSGQARYVARPKSGAHCQFASPPRHLQLQSLNMPGRPGAEGLPASLPVTASQPTASPPGSGDPGSARLRQQAGPRPVEPSPWPRVRAYHDAESGISGLVSP